LLHLSEGQKIGAVQSWISALPDSAPKNHAMEAKGEEAAGKLPIRVSYRIEPSTLQPISPAHARAQPVTGLPEKEPLSPLSLEQISLDEEMFENGLGASFAPSFDSPPLAKLQGLSLGGLATNSPCLSLDGTFPFGTDQDSLQEQLLQAGFELPFCPSSCGRQGWMQEGKHRRPGLNERAHGSSWAEDCKLEEFGL
jgi:hypothetical protein